MYQGKLEVTEERIQDLIDAAECLQIKGLGDGHKENDSGNIKNTTVLPKRHALPSGIPNKRTRRSKSEEAANIDSNESEVNNLNYRNDKRSENSVVTTCGARHSFPVQNVMADCDVQNVAIASKISYVPAKSTLSEIEMNSSHLQGEYVARREPDSFGDENMNRPMRERSKRKRVCEKSREYAMENAYERSGEESILGLSADISVPSVKNVCEDLPLVCIPSAVLSSQLCSGDLVGSSVKNDLNNININLSSESVDPVVSAVDSQDLLLHSEFHVKNEDETLSFVGYDLLNENHEFSENMPKNLGIPSISEVKMEVICMGKNYKRSGAAEEECILESIYSPLELPMASVEIQRIGCHEPAVDLIPGLPAEINPHGTPTHLSLTTPVCDTDLSGPNGSISTDQQYRCQICGETFARNVSLNAHVRMHAEDRLFRNDECNKTAITSIKLSEQRIRRGRTLYKCSVCEFKPVHLSALRIHMRIHSGLKPYKCSECKYSSADPSNMRRHQRVHGRINPYKCSECDYTCVKHGALRTHQRIHSGGKHKCSECEYSSADSSNMKRHQRTHSRVKPYKCTECEYTSAYRSHFKIHQRIHSGVKPYKWVECDYTAVSSGEATSQLGVTL